MTLSMFVRISSPVFHSDSVFLPVFLLDCGCRPLDLSYLFFVLVSPFFRCLTKFVFPCIHQPPFLILALTFLLLFPPLFLFVLPACLLVSVSGSFPLFPWPLPDNSIIFFDILCRYHNIFAVVNSFGYYNLGVESHYFDSPMVRRSVPGLAADIRHNGPGVSHATDSWCVNRSAALERESATKQRGCHTLCPQKHSDRISAKEQRTFTAEIWTCFVWLCKNGSTCSLYVTSALCLWKMNNCVVVAVEKKCAKKKVMMLLRCWVCSRFGSSKINPNEDIL